MNTDAAYALLGIGIAAAGATIGKAALDEFLTPREKLRAEERAIKAVPIKPVDKVFGSIALAISVGSLAMKLYSWYETGKAPSAAEIVG